LTFELFLLLPHQEIGFSGQQSLWHALTF
jgi:hypothetical protein